MNLDQAIQHELPYDLANEDSRKELTSIVQQWITDDDPPHMQTVEEWDDADDRLNGDYTPVGWTEDFIGQMVRANDPTVNQQDAQKTRSFVQVNRARPNHEAVLGDFIALKRKLSISGRNPDDRNRAKVLQSRIEYIEDDQMLADMVYFPMMDNAFAKGHSWCKVSYDPYANSLKGKMVVEEVSCRDVLVDNQSRGHYFNTSTRFIHRSKIRIDEAKKIFKHYPHFEPELVGSDNEYDKAWLRNRDPKRGDEHATFYDVHFRRTECKYYGIDPKSGAMQEIPPEVYEALSANPKTEQFVFVGEKEFQYYIAKYNMGTGVFALEYNPIQMWTLFPLMNIPSDSRTYPMGDILIYRNLLDLFDVLVTVFLENAKRANIPIADVDPAMWENYSAEINNALQHGGAAPGIRNIHFAQPINTHLTQLIPWVLSWIQDSISKHAASMGEVPAAQIAQKTVQTLIGKDRMSHGRKDVQIRLFLTHLAKVLAKMVCLYDNEPDFFQLKDMTAGKPGYIPINQKYTEAEYLDMLAKVSGLQVPKQPPMDRVPEKLRAQVKQQFEQENIIFEQQFIKAKNLFEQDNDVKVTQVEGWQIEGQTFTDEQLADVIQKTQLPPEQFNAMYDPQAAQIDLYIVNDLTEDIDISIKYDVQTDYRQDPEYKEQKAVNFFKMGLVGALDTLKDADYPNAEEVHKRAVDENEARQLVEQLGSDPAMMQQVVQFVQQLSTAQPAD
jgi:hypothetical protein